MSRTRKDGITDEVIIKLYQDGLSYLEMTEITGLTDRGVRYVLNQNGINTKRSTLRKHKVNENFFKTWNHRMAWVLGMFITDGCINGECSISFAQKDERILKLIAEYMEADYVLAKSSNTKMTPTLLVNSKEVKLDLNKLGITNKKSLVVPFPSVPQKYLHSFIRGVIDGDGWVQDRGYAMNVTTGSLDFANGLLSVFSNWKLNSYKKIQSTPTGGTIYRVFVSGKYDVARLSEIIYKDCDEDFIVHKRVRMSQRAEQPYSHSTTSCDNISSEVKNMWVVEENGLKNYTDETRCYFATTISSNVLKKLRLIAEENDTYPNYLLENGLQQLIKENVIIYNKKHRPNDRVMYKTTYEKDLIKDVRKFAKENKLCANDIIEHSVNFIDMKNISNIKKRSHRSRIIF